MKDYYPGNLGGNDKRFNRSHRNYTPLTRDMNGNQRRTGNHRKKGGPEIGADALNELMTSVKQKLKEIADNQNRMTDYQERTAAAQERSADAMDQIAGYLKQLLGPVAVNAVQDNIETQPTAPEPSSEIEETPEAENNGDMLLKTISDMRETGLTFGKIAEHLIAEGIPTAAGIKQWNRLSVSKYFKEAAVQ